MNQASHLEMPGLSSIWQPNIATEHVQMNYTLLTVHKRIINKGQFQNYVPTFWVVFKYILNHVRPKIDYFHDLFIPCLRFDNQPVEGF